MKKNLLPAITVFLFLFTFNQSQVFAQNSKTEKAIFEMEKVIWDAVKSKKLDSITKYFADDYLGIYGYGIVPRNDEMKDVAEVNIKEANFSDFKFINASKDVVIFVYKAKVQGTFKGQDISGDYIVSSTWANRAGKWITVAHTEAKADGASG